jgi:hypothetical protein
LDLALDTNGGRSRRARKAQKSDRQQYCDYLRFVGLAQCVFSSYCAHAARGQAAATPPIGVVNPRRLK